MNRLTLATFSALSVLAATAAFAQSTSNVPPAVGTAGSTTHAASAAAATVAPDYKLQAGDKLRVDVYRDEKLTQPQLQIRPDGKITVPLIGDLPAAGKTSLELRDDIASALKNGQIMSDPAVTVIVLETTPQVVYVTGEVTKGGPFPIINGHLDVVQAIAMAGGFTEFANKKDIRIMRHGAAGNQTIRFNYKDAIESGATPLALQAGDTIIVK